MVVSAFSNKYDKKIGKLRIYAFLQSAVQSCNCRKRAKICFSSLNKYQNVRNLFLQNFRYVFCPCKIIICDFFGLDVGSDFLNLMSNDYAKKLVH